MRLVFATEDLNINGQAYSGMPLLLNDECMPMEPAQSYLWNLLTRPGRIGSKRTWTKYGRDLYDYFAFLSANKIDWKMKPINGVPAPIDRYIEWSKGTVKLSRRTINSRIRLVSRYYKWARKNKLIETLPFEEVEISTGSASDFLIHTKAKPTTVISNDLVLKENAPLISILTKKQIEVCLASIKNETHRLILEIITRTGLRQEEARTLPEKYIFDPSRRSDIEPNQMIFVKLDPKEMRTKGSKERYIEIPYSLMEDLWWWSVRQRPKRESKNTSVIKSKTLFLTEDGIMYGDSTFTSIFNRLARKVGFPVRPHMGRHTYAVYRLISLKKSKTFEGDPLLYVMDRLGHSSAVTTAIYLKYINMLSGQLISQHEDELDIIFSKETSN